MTYRILTTMQRARLKSAMRDIDRSRRVVRAFAVLCVLAVAVLFLVSCAGARLRHAQGVPMEQALCLESRHAIVVVTGRDERGRYENTLCPLHRARPDARCVKFHCPTGHDYETLNEPLNP